MAVAIVTDGAASLTGGAGDASSGSRSYRCGWSWKAARCASPTARSTTCCEPNTSRRQVRRPATSSKPWLPCSTRDWRPDDGVVVLTIAASMSSTHQAAMLAAKDLGEQVRVIDTTTAAGAEGLVVLEAARAARAGGDLDAVEAAARPGHRPGFG